jgi:molybdate transport system ATP-binding protein
VLEIQLRHARDTFELNVSMRCPTPGVIALFGPSGAGKSTLAHIIAGLIPLQNGYIRLDGQTLSDSALGIHLKPEHRGIGYVFQDARLFPHLSVSGNLHFASKRVGTRAVYVSYDEVVSLLGLETLLARRVHTLSGGERQRVALARALLLQPRMLILDEPLAAIDTPRRAEVLPFLVRLRDRFSIPMLYVSHQYEEVLQLASYLALIDEGKILAAGHLSQLSQLQALQKYIGQEAIGSVLDAVVDAVDEGSNLASVALGEQRLRFYLPNSVQGQRIRIHVLARDVIISTQAPTGLSVRNAILCTLTQLHDEAPDSVIATLQFGQTALLSRITRSAVYDLQLKVGASVWALVKAASLRGNLL